MRVTIEFVERSLSSDKQKGERKVLSGWAAWAYSLIRRRGSGKIVDCYMKLNMWASFFRS